MYKNLFSSIDDYVSYINDNYDISKLPSDERELIEYVIETMIKGIESDIDRHMYEYNLIINICKNSYRYFKIIDKIFEKLQKIYDESLEKDVISLTDYIKMYRDIYDMKIKTMVNDVHRTIKTEDEYLEYSKLVTSEDVDEEELNKFILTRALEVTSSDKVKEILEESIKPKVEEITEDILDEVDTEITEDKLDEEDEKLEKKKTKTKKSKKTV